MSKQKRTTHTKQPAKTSKPPVTKKGSGFDINKYIEGKGIYLLSILLLLISFFVYSDFIFFKNLYIYKDIGSDTYNQFVPSLVHFTNYLRTEGIPKWSFNQGMGQNVFPGLINDPFNLFLYLFDGDHISYALVYAQLLKILTGGILFYLYLRTMSITPYASLVGAMLFAFSGYMILGGCWYGHASSVVYGAFILFSFEKLYKQNSWVFFPIAVAIISADVFAIYIYTVFLFLYTLFRYYSEHEFKSTGIIALLLKMAGLGLLGIIINAVFLVSPLLQMINSPRVSGEAGLFNALKAAPIFQFASAQEIMTAIMRTFSSDLIGSGSNFKGWQNYLEAPIFYAGVINLLLIPQVFQFLDKKRKILFAVFLGIWWIMVAFPYFRHALYLFAGDYYKSGMSFFMPVTMLYTGITALSYIDKLQKVNLMVLAASVVALLILLFYPYLPADQNYTDTNLRGVIVVFIFSYALFIWMLSSGNLKTFSQVGLMILLCIELGYFAFITTNKRMALSSNESKEKVGFNDYTVDAVNYINSTDKSFYRITKEYTSGIAIHNSLNDAMIQDYYGTPSYQSFNQLYYIRFLSEANVIHANQETETRWARGLMTRPLLQTFGNVKYTLTKRTDRSLYGMNDSINTFGDVSVFRNNFYLPLGYTYERFVTDSDFKHLSDLQKDKALFKAFVINERERQSLGGFDKLNTADTTSTLLFTEYRAYIDSLKKDTLAISEHSQNLFKGKIKLNKKKLLFFSIPYDDGWSAKVDGKEAKLELVNVGFMGLVMEKGEHDVVLEFKPPYVQSSLLISGIGLLLYSILMGIWLYWMRKEKKLKSP